MADQLKILVTGAAGFIGSHLSERLLKEGHRVYALDNFDSFYDPSIKRRNLSNCLHHPHFTLIEADIRDKDRLKAIFELHDFDQIVHLAAMAGVRPSILNPGLYAEVNIQGTLNLLELAALKEIKPFVFASSSSIYGNNKKLPFSESDPVDTPISPYAATKRAGELLCYNWHHLYNLSVVCLRFFTVYGPRQRPDLAIHKFSRLVMEDQAIPIFGDGATSRDYTYIDDIVDGIISAIKLSRSACHYEIINLGESETISLSAMLAYLQALSGKEIKRTTLPPVVGDLAHTNADISKARQVLGYNPQVPFSKGIKLWWDWFKKQ